MMLCLLFLKMFNNYNRNVTSHYLACRIDLLAQFSVKLMTSSEANK
jgi:hypothetical protein